MWEQGRTVLEQENKATLTLNTLERNVDKGRKHSLSFRCTL